MRNPWYQIRVDYEYRNFLKFKPYAFVLEAGGIWFGTIEGLEITRNL